MRAQQKGGKMKTRIVDSEITLIPYYRNDAVSLPWYQDPDVVKQVDNRDTPYDVDLLHRMYDYLSANGECYYIEYNGTLVGDVSLRNDGEIAIVSVKANIYSFNTQSQKMFQSVGFTKTAPEWYEYTL